MKKYNVYLLPDAIKDLENIYDYIAEQSGFPERAWTYIERLREKCQNLETAPHKNSRAMIRGIPFHYPILWLIVFM